MTQEFYYADLDLKVTVSEETPAILEGLTQGETLTLNQILYLALTTFLHTRAMIVAETIELAKKLAEDCKRKKAEEDGG